MRVELSSVNRLVDIGETMVPDCRPGKSPRFWPILLGLTLWCWGQPDNLHFEHIGSDQGLSHQTVSSVIQDRWGYLWFGTIDGLNRFDGYQCKVYKHDPNNPQSISSSFIHGMVEDRHGNLWVGTRDGGLSVLTVEGRKNGQFKRYSIAASDTAQLDHERVEAFYCDSDQRLWVGTQAGVGIFNEALDRFVEYDFFADVGETVLVSQFLEDRSGHLWMVTSTGLFKLDLSEVARVKPESCAHLVTRYVHHPDDPQSLSARWIRSLFIDREGRFWIGTRNRGINLFDPSTGQSRHYRNDPANPFSLSKNSASVLYQDEAGLLWVGTDGGGLNLFDPETGRFYAHRHLPNRSQSISHNNVTRVFQSRDGPRGTIWVTTWGGGVNRLIDPRKPFELFRHDPENDQSLGANFVLALMEDRSGHLWVGTNVAGLNRLDSNSGRWQHFVNRPGDPTSLGHNTVWAIQQDLAGDIWVATEQGGLNRWLPNSFAKGGQFDRFRRDPQREDSILEDNVKTLFEDREGYLWLGYENLGMSRGRPGSATQTSWQHFQHDSQDPGSINHNTVRCFAQDPLGRLWIGTAYGGLSRLVEINAQGKASFFNYPVRENDPNHLNHGDIRALLPGTDSGLWVATFGGGLNRLDLTHGTFRHYTTAHGLANNFVYGLLDDDLGYLWVSTNRGLSRFHYASETFTNFDTQHGLQSDEFNTGAFFNNGKGDLYFGGVNGFNKFNPDQLMQRLAQDKAFQPNIVLTQFEKMGAPMAISVSPASQDALTLTHTDQFFSFEMAVLDYHQPEKNRFRYRLEGFDRSWIDNGTRRFASYTNLDPGDYRLHYQGANHTGVWHDGEPLALVIAKPFWQTWWFRAVALIVLALLVGLIFRIKHYYQTYRSVNYLAHFKLIRKLGQGGAGTVYLAKDRLSKRQIALKVLHSDMQESHDGIRRFLQEAEIGSRLRHPNIVTIFEAGNHEQTRYLCMEYLQGQTLRDFLAGGKILTLQEIIELSQQILKGLKAIHDQGIVHRDLKAANLMVLPDGQLKIMDFGLARIGALTTVENRNQLMGTLAYMSPEQTLGKGVDRRSDLYAFGAILHQLVFAKLPFHAQNEMEMIYAIHNETPVGLAHRDRDAAPIDAIVAKCLAKEPQDRYGDVGEILVALEALKPKNEDSRLETRLVG